MHLRNELLFWALRRVRVKRAISARSTQPFTLFPSCRKVPSSAQPSIPCRARAYCGCCRKKLPSSAFVRSHRCPEPRYGPLAIL